MNSPTGGSGPEESGATQLMVLPGTHGRQVPSQSWHLFIRLQLSHPWRYKQSSYLSAWQSQILQVQSEWTINIYYHSLEYWHKFPHWKWCSVQRHRYNYGMAFRWEECTLNIAINLQHRQAGF